MSQWPIPAPEHSWEVKQLWTPAHPRTGPCGSAQHLAPPWTRQKRQHFPLKTAWFVTQRGAGTLRDGVEQECPGMLCSPAWDCASTPIPGILGAKQPPPSADKLLEQTGKLEMFPPAFYPLALRLSEDEVILCQQQKQQRHSSGPASLCGSRNSCYSPQKFSLA